MKNLQVLQIDEKLEFQFISIEDFGDCNCPHCGANGRYIYTWSEFGILKSAMSGCYKLLTRHIKMGELDKFIEGISEREAKGKPLNGWQKTVKRMQQFKYEGKYSIEWCDRKINEALNDYKQYSYKK